MALYYWVLGFCALVACGDDQPAIPDAPPDASSATGADIGQVLEGCTAPLGVNGRANPNEMELHVVDTERFPDALCNDGSPAILYYRPHRGAANKDRWVISLRGGGGCGSAAACASRWCGCSDGRPCEFSPMRSIFTANNMSGSGRRGEEGGGIDGRDPAHPSPFDDYNQVQLHYCSSDAWRGNARGVQYTTVHPRRGDMITYTMHFLGAAILDADLATLEQDGVPALAYTLGGGSVAMPDLNDAVEVVVTGDSGGGAGVLQRLDAVADHLRASATGAPPEIIGIIDSVAGPEQSRLDYTSSSYGAPYSEIMAVIASSAANQGARADASCLAYHEPRGTPGYCLDETHVIRHHLTTPFFYRMGLIDSLISKGYIEDDIFVEGTTMNLRDNIGLFGVLMHNELAAFDELPTLVADDHEQASVPPGVFGPACGFHDTLHEPTQTFQTTIAPAGPGSERTVLDVFASWRADPSSPQARLLTEDIMRTDTVCP